MARAKTFTIRQIGEEFARRLEELHDAELAADRNSNNLRVAKLKARDALTYLARWEDPKSPERLTDGELTK